MSLTPADRLHGCMLGLAAGDALGAPYQTMTGPDIFQRFGLLDRIIANLSTAPLRYTGLTVQAVVVADQLADGGEIDGANLARRLAERFAPERGYYPGTRQVLQAVQGGDDYRTAAAAPPGAGDANDAAVRASAVGLTFADDLDRVWMEAKKSARPTHPAPLAIEGAQLFAGAVALAARGEPIDRRAFLNELLGRAKDEQYRWALRTAVRLKRSDSVAVLGNGMAAPHSVVTAVACFAATPADFTLAVGRALGLGGSTAALAAMTGALCGVHGGSGVVPNDVATRLEPLPARPA